MKKKKRTVSSNIPLRSRIWKSRQYYLLILPAVIYVLIFCYAPMYGLQIAFKDYKVSLGILGSRWVGFRNFTDFWILFLESDPQYLRPVPVHAVCGVPGADPCGAGCQRAERRI